MNKKLERAEYTVTAVCLVETIALGILGVLWQTEVKNSCKGLLQISCVCPCGSGAEPVRRRPCSTASLVGGGAADQDNG